MMEVRLAESCPHAPSPVHSCDTQWTRRKRNYKGTTQASDGRRKMRRHDVRAWLRRAGACDMYRRCHAAAMHLGAR